MSLLGPFICSQYKEIDPAIVYMCFERGKERGKICNTFFFQHNCLQDAEPWCNVSICVGFITVILQWWNTGVKIIPLRYPEQWYLCTQLPSWTSMWRQTGSTIRSQTPQTLCSGCSVSSSSWISSVHRRILIFMYCRVFLLHCTPRCEDTCKQTQQPPYDSSAESANTLPDNHHD